MINKIRRWIKRKDIAKLDKLPKFKIPPLIIDEDWEYHLLKNKEDFK